MRGSVNLYVSNTTAVRESLNLLVSDSELEGSLNLLVSGNTGLRGSINMFVSDNIAVS